ncbi:hypothetical protein FSP39_008667 [Pinctada imbricata]|uniref:DNA excision repair protein ERCC-1 n=1 Tax=Pinctada imbricata TaxID=66713 RepID=A0AA89BVL9_PINIB|nr:hypothetical protein FSP39_008667 [Pinctada imbricata]
MAEKKKFRIPTASEMEVEPSASTSSVKSFSKFMSMKKTGELSDACDLDSSMRSGVSTDARDDKGQAAQSGSGKASLGKGASMSRGMTNVTAQTIQQPASSSKDKVSVDTSQLTPSTSSMNAVKNTNMVQEEIKFATLKPGKMNSIIVNARQRGNPILKHIRSIPWEYGDINPDYLLGQTTCALYLSLRYHQLNPNYIHERLKKLGKSFELRVLLVQVDVKEPHHLVKDLAKICILADCTLILAFSTEEAGRYLETYKIYESKPPDAIMEKTEKDYMSKMVDCLTSIKSVNKTDVMTLLSAFGSLEGVSKASEEEISLCPGFGPQKAKRVHDMFQEPFLKAKKLRKS